MYSLFTCVTSGFSHVCPLSENMQVGRLVMLKWFLVWMTVSLCVCVCECPVVDWHPIQGAFSHLATLSKINSYRRRVVNVYCPWNIPYALLGPPCELWSGQISYVQSCPNTEFFLFPILKVIHLLKANTIHSNTWKIINARRLMGWQHVIINVSLIHPSHHSVSGIGKEWSRLWLCCSEIIYGQLWGSKAMMTMSV